MLSILLASFALNPTHAPKAIGVIVPKFTIQNLSLQVHLPDVKAQVNVPLQYNQLSCLPIYVKESHILLVGEGLTVTAYNAGGSSIWSHDVPYIENPTRLTSTGNEVLYFVGPNTISGEAMGSTDESRRESRQLQLSVCRRVKDGKQLWYRPWNDVGSELCALSRSTFLTINRDVVFIHGRWKDVGVTIRTLASVSGKITMTWQFQESGASMRKILTDFCDAQGDLTGLWSATLANSSNLINRNSKVAREGSVFIFRHNGQELRITAPSS